MRLAKQKTVPSALAAFSTLPLTKTEAIAHRLGDVTGGESRQIPLTMSQLDDALLVFARVASGLYANETIRRFIDSA